MILAIAIDPNDLRPAVRAVFQLLLCAGSVAAGPYMFLRGFRAL